MRFYSNGWRIFSATDCSCGACVRGNRDLGCDSGTFDGWGVKENMTREEWIQFIVISIIYAILHITKELIKERKSKK